MSGLADVNHYIELQRMLFTVFPYITCHEDNFATFSIRLESLFVDV
jgi:hypothetical protein